MGCYYHCPMRQTAYERTKRLIGPGIAAARGRLEAHKGPLLNALVDLFTTSLEQKTLKSDDVIAVLPYAISQMAAERLEDPFDWNVFATTDEVRALTDFDLRLGSMLYEDRLNNSWVGSSIINLWQYQCHARAGERVYELTEGLGERLLHTELHGLNTEDLRLPYRNIYIVVPPELGLTLENEQTGTHQLEGVYITEYERGGLRTWKLLFWGPANGRSQHEWDDTIFHFSVDLPEGQSLNDALDKNEALRTSESFRGTPGAAKFYKQSWRQLFTLVMNTVVYCTWPDAEVIAVQNPEFVKLHERMRKHPKGSGKYERTRAKLRETLEQRRILLGASSKRLGKAETSGEGSPLTVRTLVSGHWKRQVHGEGRSLRKWIFIEPFWRGPETAPESNPRRVLEVS